MSGPLMLVDAAGLWFRAFYALPESITAPDGRPVNAVRGFLDMLAALITREKPSRLVVCLDLDWRPQFRVQLLPEYKAHRVQTGVDPAAPGAGPGEAEPASLGPQVEMILELLAAFGIATAGAEGFEADDVIATLADRERRDEVVVVTGDRDLLQLVADDPVKARVLYIGRGIAKAEMFGPAELAERYGLPHERPGAAYTEFAVLRGDPSDGLSGVAGVGEKTAAKLLAAHTDLATALAAAKNGEVVPARLGKALAEAADYVERAVQVVSAQRQAPVVLDRVDQLPKTINAPERLAELSDELGVKASAERLVKALGLNRK